jgi:hypothetical protein
LPVEPMMRIGDSVMMRPPVGVDCALLAILFASCPK